MTLFFLSPSLSSYEKMISGKYLGEIAKLAMCRLVREGLLFGGKATEKFGQFESFETKYVSLVEQQ